ncbi:MAG: CAP domain-containing protein [Sandaracinaceae bacterium]|nr:CAP domain-containing protein [Sandaracinaceae bacterium]
MGGRSARARRRAAAERGGGLLRAPPRARRAGAAHHGARPAERHARGGRRRVHRPVHAAAALQPLRRRGGRARWAGRGRGDAQLALGRPRADPAARRRRHAALGARSAHGRAPQPHGGRRLARRTGAAPPGRRRSGLRRARADGRRGRLPGRGGRARGARRHGHRELPRVRGTGHPRARPLRPRDLRRRARRRNVRRELFDLVNATRREAGLPPLREHEGLREVALAHSRDMAENDFIGHTSPRSGTAADRVRAASLSSGLVLENIGRGYGAAEIHRGLMESPGHRANLVNPDVSHVGIGVVAQPEGARSAFIVTEVFIRMSERVDLTGRRSASSRSSTARGARGARRPSRSRSTSARPRSARRTSSSAIPA